jgi:hypothetical protein
MIGALCRTRLATMRCAPCVLFAILSPIAFEAGCRKDVSVDDSRPIRVGMTRDEVQKILGKAPESKSVDTVALAPESHSKAEIDAWNTTTIQLIDIYPSVRVKYNIEHRVLAVEQR